ncbi:MAG: hypothetical protein JWL72_4041 [Ilumatobacteraceae bacterium]|nr:hypothetical protein [Ilumatobacteraceae bacterium]
MNEDPPDTIGTDDRDARDADRRGLLRLAIATAGVAIVASSGSTPVQAAQGGNVIIGSQGNFGTQETTIVHNGTSSNGPALTGYRTSSNTIGVTSSENCGVLGSTDIAGGAGVIGFGGVGGAGFFGETYGGQGVLGRTTMGVGVQGDVEVGGTGVGGQFIGGRAQLLLTPASTAGAPATQAHVTGEIFLDKNGTVFVCTAAGSPGTWREIGGSGASNLIGVSSSGQGVLGRTTTGVGVQGDVTAGGTGVPGQFGGGRAQLLLIPASTAGAPTTQAHAQGEIFLDNSATVFVCTAAGTPGTWRDISTLPAQPAPTPAAPSLHFVTPTRVFDSREALPAAGAIASGQNLTVSVADGRAISGGAVTAANLVPFGATGVAYNLTIVNTVGQGYLTINPGGNTTVGSSAINWYATGQIVACASVVALDPSRQVTVIAGGAGTTDS